MNAKIVPEIELNNDIESNIQRVDFIQISFECHICFEEFSYNIKDFQYTSQCDTGKHYLCADCNKNWIKTCNENRKDHICVVCKNLINKYQENVVIHEENETNMNNNITRRPVLITNHNVNNSTPFVVKLLIFDFIFIIISLIIMNNMKLSENTKNGIYFMYGFLMLCTLLACCITTESNVRIVP